MIFDIDTYGSRLAIIADDGIKWRESIDRQIEKQKRKVDYTDVV